MSKPLRFPESTDSDPSSDFQPFVRPQATVKELTLKSVLFGIFFSILIGASSVYLALRAGLTLGGSIPVAVISVGLLKRFGKTTILENNIVQTIGSAGESVGGNMVFRIAGLIFLAEGARYFRYPQVVTLAILGGLLGILFMIPLRRILIAKEHKTLPYPEGSACAEVLVAGEQQGPLAKPVFVGALVGTVYWLLMKFLGLWNELPHLIRRTAAMAYPNATLPVDVTPEYLGIGYIIGFRAAFQMLMGSLFTWLVIVPTFSAWPKLASLLGAKDVFTTLHSLGITVDNTQELPTAAQVHAAFGKFIAVGAVVFAGVFTIVKTFPVMLAGLRNAMDSLRHQDLQVRLRTERDLPMWLVAAGLGLLFVMIPLLPYLPGSFPLSLLVTCLIVVFAFFFVTVSSRLVGVIGYSMEPTGPMMFTIIMATCLIFLLCRLTAVSYQPLVLMVGAVACSAAGNAGATSQDLKTGFLLGATPWKQQVSLVLGLVISALVVGGVVILIDHSIPNVPHAIGYLAPGDDSPKFAAPSANLVSILINTVLSGKVPWGLVLTGACIALVAEISGLSALSFAAGIYLPGSATTAICLGAVIRFLIARKEKQNRATISNTFLESEVSPGMLYATGLVAAGSLAGMLLGFFGAFLPKQAALFNIGHDYWKSMHPIFGDGIALVAYITLSAFLYHGAKRKPKH